MRRIRTPHVWFGVFFLTLITGVLFSGQAKAIDIKGNDLEIIMDCSGSMAGQIGGQSKIEIAKNSLNSVVNSIPDGSYVGFRAYGHQSPEGQKNCQDTQLIFPIGAINKGEMLSKINSLQPRGWTPIDYTLRQSRNDFNANAEYGKMIILVSDGEETCGGDPCQAVKDLTASGFKVVVNTVGFDVDSKAEAQLRCIAQATGGEYKSARNASELTESMRVFSSRAFEGFKTAGGVKAGAGFVDAPLVTSGKFGGDILIDESKFYKINVLEGQKVTAVWTLRKEQPLSGNNWMWTCMTPSLKIYDKYQSAVSEQTAKDCDDKNGILGIAGPDLGPATYKAIWTADSSGEAFISLTNKWESNIGSPEQEAEKAKKNKGLYDLTVAIEGEGKAPEAAAPAEPKKPTNPAADQSAGTTAQNGRSSSETTNWMIVIVIGIFVISLAVIAVFYLKRRSGTNNSLEQFTGGSVTNSSNDSSGNDSISKPTDPNIPNL